MINGGAVAWLRSSKYHSGTRVAISAGTTMPEFVRLAEKGGGEIYYSKSQLEAYAQSELSALRSWKESAMQQLGKWDEVSEYVRTHGGRVGHDVQSETLRLLKQLDAIDKVINDPARKVEYGTPEYYLLQRLSTKLSV